MSWARSSDSALWKKVARRSRSARLEPTVPLESRMTLSSSASAATAALDRYSSSWDRREPAAGANSPASRSQWSVTLPGAVLTVKAAEPPAPCWSRPEGRRESTSGSCGRMRPSSVATGLGRLGDLVDAVEDVAGQHLCEVPDLLRGEVVVALPFVDLGEEPLEFLSESQVRVEDLRGSRHRAL